MKRVGHFRILYRIYFPKYIFFHLGLVILTKKVTIINISLSSYAFHKGEKLIEFRKNITSIVANSQLFFSSHTFRYLMPFPYYTYAYKKVVFFVFFKFSFLSEMDIPVSVCSSPPFLSSPFVLESLHAVKFFK